MSEILNLVDPVIFKGGQAAEYAVEVLKNGGFGTRHLPSGSVVPHVLSKVPAEALKQGIPVGTPANLTEFASGGASAALQAAQPWLAAANLGVGLLNLGVSAWTAWKVHKMDKKLDGIADGVERVDVKVDRVGNLLGESMLHLDRLIQGNSLLLGVIIENQGQLGESVALLREDVTRGFRSVHVALTSAEARRKAQELERQMRSLFRYYKLCTGELQDGRQPPTADLRRIIDEATNLIALLDTRLDAIPVGRPERLPLLVARGFALRMEVEARDQLDEAPVGRAAEFDLVRGVIRNELRALTEGAPLFAVAVERRVLVEQYVYLNRALKSRATMVEFSDGSVVPFYPQSALTWDDGLEPVRHAASLRDGDPAAARIELKTLEEHHSLRRLTRLPPGGTEDYVDRDFLVKVLGLPSADNVSEHSLRELLLVGPSVAEDARARIKAEVE